MPQKKETGNCFKRFVNDWRTEMCRLDQCQRGQHQIFNSCDVFHSKHLLETYKFLGIFGNLLGIFGNFIGKLEEKTNHIWHFFVK